MEIALIIAIVLIVWILWFIVYKLLNTLENIAKLLKADNLQEYLMEDSEPENKIQVWQNERFQDIWTMTDDDLRNVKIDPNHLYNWALWGKPTTENFNW